MDGVASIVMNLWAWYLVVLCGSTSDTVKTITRHTLLSMRVVIQNGVLHELGNRNGLKLTRYDKVGL